jgi:hypothetical protein
MVVKVLVTQKGLEFINKILEVSKSDGNNLKYSIAIISYFFSPALFKVRGFFFRSYILQ